MEPVTSRQATAAVKAGRARARGQVLVMFVGSLLVLLGMAALVVDVSWLWANSLRVQRAADAAALAGVVWLPADPTSAYTTARNEATKNGYLDGSGGIVVVPAKDASNDRKLRVRISAPVTTYFLGIFGFNQVTVSKDSSAEYVLPVPMGSPQNYYGVFKIRTPSDPTGTRAGAWPAGAAVPDALSGTLTSQGFWGTMISQGADKVNGDNYLASNDGGGANVSYAPNDYYQYAIEMAPGSSGGSVWIYDPLFCGTDSAGRYGTGDRWFNGTGATSAFYDLFDARGTAYDLTDDTLYATSGNFFRNVRASDPSLGGPAVGGGVTDCTYGAAGVTSGDPRYYHLRWWQLATGLSGGATGRIYRLHISSTEAAAPGAQAGADGHNSFAIEARATTGAAPRVYGLGTMEAFSPLNGGGASIFYLAQIEAIHAGKTMEIKLYDPGDTGSLAANLQILQPGSGGYTAANFTYTAKKSAVNGVACDARTGSGTSVQTNTGGTSLFNGCWLTITIQLPTTYSAPTPPGEPGPGWWKIQYNMSGTTANTAFDLTTWQVNLRGNPVHLVVP